MLPAIRAWWRHLSAINHARKQRRVKARLRQVRRDIEHLDGHHALIVAGYGAAIQGLDAGLLRQEKRLDAIASELTQILSCLPQRLIRGDAAGSNGDAVATVGDGCGSEHDAASSSDADQRGRAGGARTLAGSP